nr:polysaccharide biosynthesis C-terminal domain-containing protein [Allopontixanthobacter confluentis]
MAGVAILAAPVLVSIFAPAEYGAAVAITGFFVIGQFWLGATSITSIGIHGARVTSRLTYVFGAGAAINFLTLALLSQSMGMLAAAIGFLASQIVGTILAAWYSERHFSTNFHGRSLVCAAIASAILAVGSFEIYRPFADPEVSRWTTYLPYLEMACLVAALAAIISAWGIEREVLAAANSEVRSLRSRFRVLLK